MWVTRLTKTKLRLFEATVKYIKTFPNLVTFTLTSLIESRIYPKRKEEKDNCSERTKFIVEEKGKGKE